MSNFAWCCYSLRFFRSHHFQWPWPYFKFTGVSNSFNWKNWCCYTIRSKLCIIVNYVDWIMNILYEVDWALKANYLFLLTMYHYSWLSHILEEDNWCVVWSDEKKSRLFVGHYLNEDFQTLPDHKLAWCPLIHIRFGDLDLFQGHRCVRNIDRILCFLDSCRE